MSGMMFNWFMRNAAKLLLVFAILIVIGAVWHGVAQLLELQKESDAGIMQPPGIDAGMYAYALASALGSASLPLFGAAVIWRWDRHIGDKRERTAE